jgi:hypothetical protein
MLSYFLRREMSKTEDYKDVYEISRKEIQIWRDEAGKTRARAEIAEIDAASAKLVLESNLKETIRKEVGNLKRNLISYSSVRSSTGGTFQTGSIDTVYLMDQPQTVRPIPAKKFEINQPDLKFQGLYIPDLDTLMADYQVTHNFDIFYYYRKPGKKPFNLFRRKQAVAEIKFDNPGSQADSLYTIVLERKKSLISKIF